MRKRLSARLAIMRPEINDHDLAAMPEDFLLQPVVLDGGHDDFLFLRLAAGGAQERKDGKRKAGSKCAHERIPPRTGRSHKFHLTAPPRKSPRDPGAR